PVERLRPPAESKRGVRNKLSAGSASVTFLVAVGFAPGCLDAFLTMTGNTTSAATWSAHRQPVRALRSSLLKSIFTHSPVSGDGDYRCVSSAAHPCDSTCTVTWAILYPDVTHRLTAASTVSCAAPSASTVWTLIAFTPVVSDQTCRSGTPATPSPPAIAARRVSRLTAEGAPSSRTPTASRSSIHVRGRMNRPIPAEISGSA